MEVMKIWIHIPLVGLLVKREKAGRGSAHANGKTTAR
jgi:hypothetical protein